MALLYTDTDLVSICKSIALETETSNKSATALYEKLGFIKEELLVRYYLNLGDAYRMKLYFS